MNLAVTKRNRLKIKGKFDKIMNMGEVVVGWKQRGMENKDQINVRFSVKTNCFSHWLDMLCGGIWDLLWRREIDVNWKRKKENTERGN